LHSPNGALLKEILVAATEYEYLAGGFAGSDESRRRKRSRANSMPTRAGLRLSSAVPAAPMAPAAAITEGDRRSTAFTGMRAPIADSVRKMISYP
jgi:hypothetical protein